MLVELSGQFDHQTSLRVHIRTRFHAAMPPEQAKLNLEKRIPLHREGTPEDVAAVIATLATNDFITGENLVIDGGTSMRIVEGEMELVEMLNQTWRCGTGDRPPTRGIRNKQPPESGPVAT